MSVSVVVNGLSVGAWCHLPPPKTMFIRPLPRRDDLLFEGFLDFCSGVVGEGKSRFSALVAFAYVSFFLSAFFFVLLILLLDKDRDGCLTCDRERVF